jgi:hypothetical protein
VARCPLRSSSVLSGRMRTTTLTVSFLSAISMSNEVVVVDPI